MTNEEAIKVLTAHIIQCGMLMPLDWVKSNGDGSEFMQAMTKAFEALEAQKENHGEI